MQACALCAARSQRRCLWALAPRSKSACGRRCRHTKRWPRSVQRALRCAASLNISVCYASPKCTGNVHNLRTCHGRRCHFVQAPRLKPACGRRCHRSVQRALRCVANLCMSVRCVPPRRVCNGSDLCVCHGRCCQCALGPRLNAAFGAAAASAAGAHSARCSTRHGKGDTAAHVARVALRARCSLTRQTHLDTTFSTASLGAEMCALERVCEQLAAVVSGAQHSCNSVKQRFAPGRTRPLQAGVKVFCTNMNARLSGLRMMGWLQRAAACCHTQTYVTCIQAEFLRTSMMLICRQ